ANLICQGLHVARSLTNYRVCVFMTVLLHKGPISSAPLPLIALTGPDPKSSPLPAGRDALTAD
ncbi:MAG: hypothetical protein JSV40_04745, partial [Deltaproteobacteria bacterium]